MSDLEDVARAEARMNAAKDALLDYVQQRKRLEGKQYRRLVARVKKTQAEFLGAVSQLGE